MSKVFKKFYFFIKYNSLKKFINLILCFYSIFIEKKSYVRHYPIKLIIDSGNICQLKCPLCPTGQNKNTRNKCFLELDNFKKIIDEAGEYLYGVDLYNWGEPFLNKDIFNMIEYAQKNNIKVQLSSNLNRFPDDYAEKLVKSGLEKLILSIDGASQESYSKYRVGGDFEKVINNIKKIANAKIKLKTKTPEIIWQFLVNKYNEMEIEQATKIAKEICVDKILFSKMRCDMGNEILMNDSKKVVSIKSWLGENKEHHRYDIDEKKRKIKPSRCSFIKTTMVINADGSVSPCCGVYDQKWDFGNIFEDKLINIWNNKKYTTARAITAKRLDLDKNIICSFCTQHGFID
jgi:radical SAM protein with 4Fe4S-binding SPASM domain